MKTIVISGGAGGLGKETARILSAEHAVIILDIDEAGLKLTSEELNIEAYKCDISDWENVEETVLKILKKHESIDFVINNAGIWIEGELIDNDPKLIRKVIEVNLLGTINLTKAFLPHFKKKKAGTFININSEAGLYAKSERSVYYASKWGMRGFAKSLDMEMKRYKVRVMNIYPGKMNSPKFFNGKLPKNIGNALHPEYVAKTIKYLVNLPDDISIPDIGIKNIKY